MGLPPEPPDEQPPPPPPPVDAEGGECPRCGTPYEPFQEYCLECGLRLPVTHGVIPVLATAWRRRMPWYPGDWIWPVLGALVVAALAARDRDPRQRTTTGRATKTQRPATRPCRAGPATGHGAAAGRRTRPARADDRRCPTPPSRPSRPPPPPPAGERADRVAAGSERLDDRARLGPAERRTGGRRSARRRKAIGAGLTDVGVLNSAEFSSLHSGLLRGLQRGLQLAERGAERLDTAKGTYPQAYARQIDPVEGWPHGASGRAKGTALRAGPTRTAEVGTCRTSGRSTLRSTATGSCA